MTITDTSYLKTYALLLGLLALTIGMAVIDLGALNLPIALLVASAKAVLIMLIFMHLRISNSLLWLVAAGGLVWLLIMLALTLADYGTRASGH